MSLLKSISESFNEFLNKECEIENFEQKYINESTELSAGKTKELLAKINAGEFGKIKYIIVNSTPEKYQVANNKNVKDVDKLTDRIYQILLLSLRVMANWLLMLMKKMLVFLKQYLA